MTQEMNPELAELLADLEDEISEEEGFLADPDLYEVAFQVTCKSPDDLPSEYLNGVGECGLDGIHRLVFRHEVSSLSEEEAAIIGRRLFNENVKPNLDEIGEFVAVRVLIDDPMDYDHMHGIFDAEPTPTPTRGI
jgi:hypothetical protein